MKLRRIEIKNFKAISDIELETDSLINVIVGPNAVGKTTVLEAIRLVKSLLSPRYFQEPQQVLQSLGALSANFPMMGRAGFDFAAIANDPKKDISINVEFELTSIEIGRLKAQADESAMAILQARMARNDDAAQLQFTQFLSSQDGRAQLAAAKTAVTAALNGLRAGEVIPIHLKIFAASGQINGDNALNQQFIASLDRALPPQLTMFSYFPADRAFPQGEVGVQLGSADAQAQLQSHMGTPSTKYGRLKVSITQGVLLGKFDKPKLEKEFSTILDNLLPGKHFENITSNNVGVIKVMVKDVDSNKVFDIDNMSSGEKGLVSIFLLTHTTLADGAILLLDEPELHLNPAVSRNIMEYISKYCCKRHDAQVFICTHSPEILSDAYSMDECNLFHLRSGNDLSPVYRTDDGEVLEILERLGVSTADVLFSKGNIFVEGDHDDEILSEGFNDLVGSYKITPLGGRAEVEKAIKELSNTNKDIGKVKLFIYDRDRKPGDISSNGNVIVEQLTRYCLENYLLEDKQLYDVVLENAAVKPASRGEFMRALKEDAFAQIERFAIIDVYKSMEPQNPGLRPAELKGKTVEQAADILAQRLNAIRAELEDFEGEKWKQEFLAEIDKRKNAIQGAWQENWKVEADGKLLIDRLYERYTIRLDKLTFKKRVIRAMRQDRTKLWRTLSTMLSNALSKKST